MHRLGAVVLAFWLWSFATAAGAAEADFAVQNGWFYAQAGGGEERGYALSDDGDVGFWRDYRRLGGARTLGFPASWRYVGADGFIYQATQAALLQWRPEQERAVLANAFDVLSDAGKDDWLLAAKAIPAPVADDGSRGDPTRSAAIRLSWLDDEGIRGYYFANPNPGEIAPGGGLCSAASPPWGRIGITTRYPTTTSATIVTTMTTRVRDMCVLL
jgi:hypothetical protein